MEPVRYMVIYRYGRQGISARSFIADDHEQAMNALQHGEQALQISKGNANVWELGHGTETPEL